MAASRASYTIKSKPMKGRAKSSSTILQDKTWNDKFLYDDLVRKHIFHQKQTRHIKTWINQNSIQQNYSLVCIPFSLLSHSFTTINQLQKSSVHNKWYAQKEALKYAKIYVH